MPDPAPPAAPAGASPEPLAARRARAARRVLALLAVAGTSAAAWGYLVEPYRVELTEHAVGSGPTAVTLLHLTDLHVGQVGAREERVLELARAARPDLIVITGDTVTAAGEGFRPSAATAVLRALVALGPPLGVFACPGNHEDWEGPEGEACYTRAGVPYLRDQDVSLLGGRLVLHGLASATPRRAVATPGYDLVLCHYPAVLPRVCGPGVELVLAGHTHGGQVCLPGGHALVLPYDSAGYAAGWFEREGTRMYVSRGVGNSILPLRFACRPEVALLRLDLVPRP